MNKHILWLILLLPLNAPAQITPSQLDLLAAEVQPQVVEWRRWFHENPELSNREFKTAAQIEGILREMGLEPQTGIAHTGIIAIIEGGKPGPMVAIRSDMDGLPVVEQTGLPFASTKTDVYNGQDVGVMHACGHDNHMSMLLGAAWVLNSVKEDLAGSVMLVFQPAEEGAPEGEAGGAELMLKEGIWAESKPEAVFGIHVGIATPGGQIAVKPGPLMAAVDSFEIIVVGKQSHGAMPWNGIDPIVVASQIVLGLQTIVSRQVDVTLAPSIVSVGRISGGVRNNVIPDRVEMEGTIRTFDENMRREIHARIENTARAIASAAGAEIEFKLLIGYPAVNNNAELFEKSLPILQRVSGDNPVNIITPQTVAEDFSFFANETPGLFLFLGNGPPDVDPTTLPGNHSPYFDMYEPNLEMGVRIFSNLVVDYLNN
ncbi:MAG: amidohydrolase [Xanthomonadales bacterium]|jgi:amidohydrolase|nr:amidohydrolase [Xanthomonadales bacterium]MDH3940273.1 amidohydrolase [Xanthomonadales bacterium]MDH4000439.1 amidohydrolase [Xanthomonadales bacterium]